MQCDSGCNGNSECRLEDPVTGPWIGSAAKNAHNHLSETIFARQRTPAAGILSCQTSMPGPVR